jgi:hypothetical protein
MTKAALKKKIHAGIDQIQDQNVLGMIHTILQSHLVEEDLSPAQKKELELAVRDYDSGRGETFTWAQSKRMIREEYLKKKSKKNVRKK